LRPLLEIRISASTWEPNSSAKLANCFQIFAQDSIFAWIEGSPPRWRTRIPTLAGHQCAERGRWLEPEAALDNDPPGAGVLRILGNRSLCRVEHQLRWKTHLDADTWSVGVRRRWAGWVFDHANPPSANGSRGYSTRTELKVILYQSVIAGKK
jgi:hypothetical protein